MIVAEMKENMLQDVKAYFFGCTESSKQKVTRCTKHSENSADWPCFKLQREGAALHINVAFIGGYFVLVSPRNSAALSLPVCLSSELLC